ncbi:MAG: hypothetical protein ACYCXK_08610, partial [Candidatus Humimicrobiaceae bacterium]
MKTDKDIASEKNKARKKVKNLLDNLSVRTYKLKNKAITDTLLKSDEYDKANTVFIYHPFRKE